MSFSGAGGGRGWDGVFGDGAGRGWFGGSEEAVVFRRACLWVVRLTAEFMKVAPPCQRGPVREPRPV
ncbi:MAG: hypothetical protein M3494_11455 [Actinomycetota bacterium]|nr:hypothetical protein [Actinomycetota bacterium]